MNWIRNPHIAKLFAIIIFIAAIPTIGFYVGVKYQQTKEAQEVISTSQFIRPVTGTIHSEQAPLTDTNTEYDNFGVSFRYPSEWGIPVESFASFLGLQTGTISFEPQVAFTVFIERSTDSSGEIPLETFDQKMARYINQDNVYQSKDVLVNGVKGKELFYKSAVDGKPYSIEAYFPFDGNGRYITLNGYTKSLGSKVQAVSQGVFDKIVSTFRIDNTTKSVEDAMGLYKYKNNGIEFMYPPEFETDQASLSIHTSVKPKELFTFNSDGCPVSPEEFGYKPPQVVYFNNIKFCYSLEGDAGMGHVYNTYRYEILRGNNIYSIDYDTSMTNCSFLKNSEDPRDPENENYNQCLEFHNNIDSLVVTPIKSSISTFKFTGSNDKN